MFKITIHNQQNKTKLSIGTPDYVLLVHFFLMKIVQWKIILLSALRLRIYFKQIPLGFSSLLNVVLWLFEI